MNQFKRLIIASLTLGFFAACAPTADQMSNLLEQHPEILARAIEKNPDQFMAAVKKAAQSSQAKSQQEAAKAEAAKFEDEFKNPLKPEIDANRSFMGTSAAPITIVEYTDFQCPYCGRGYETLEQVRKAYGDKVRVLVKDLPLPMHPMAMPAAKRFEAIRLQSPEKANAFYHEVFSNQQKLGSEQDKFLDAVTKKVGADLARAKKDSGSDAVQAVITKDMSEAEGFGITGTPGFIINGVSIKGAYPFEQFKKIIDRKLADNK